MIYADIVLKQNEVNEGTGVKTITSIFFNFFGKTNDEKMWKEKITTFMDSRPDAAIEDIFRFFALNNWKRSGSLSFYRENGSIK